MDAEDYAKKYADQYTERDWFETVLVEARRRRVLDSISRHPHARVLEVGCGLEPLFTRVTDFDRFTVVEPCVPFVEAAQKLAANRSDVEIVTGFLEQMPLEAATGFDFIVVSSLLHEVGDPVALLGAVRSLCGPQTVAHFNVPNVRSFHRLLALEMGLIAELFEMSEMERRFQRSTRYDKDKFLSALDSAGFDVLRFETYFVKPFTHRQMESVFDAKIVDRSALEALDRMTRYMPDLGAEMYAEVRRR